MADMNDDFATAASMKKVADDNWTLYGFLACFLTFLTSFDRVRKMLQTVLDSVQHHLAGTAAAAIVEPSAGHQPAVSRAIRDQQTSAADNPPPPPAANDAAAVPQPTTTTFPAAATARRSSAAIPTHTVTDEGDGGMVAGFSFYSGVHNIEDMADALPLLAAQPTPPAVDLMNLPDVNMNLKAKGRGSMAVGYAVGSGVYNYGQPSPTSASPNTSSADPTNPHNKSRV